MANLGDEPSQKRDSFLFSFVALTNKTRDEFMRKALDGDTPEASLSNQTQRPKRPGAS